MSKIFARLLEIAAVMVYTIYKANAHFCAVRSEVKRSGGGYCMSKGVKVLIAVISIIGAAAAAKLLYEIFSSRLRKYYLVDGD